jgi:membrane protein DedA with SNARE-associated domain
MSGYRRRNGWLLSHFLPHWLDETRKNKDKQGDESGHETIDTKRPYHKNLYKGEIKRCNNTNKRNYLKNTTQKSMKEKEFKGSKNENDTKENNTELGERNAEDARILACSDNIAVRKISDGTDEWRISHFMLRKIYRIGKPAESENHYTHDPSALHSVQNTRFGKSLQQEICYNRKICMSPFLIILGAFFSEDVTAVIIGILAADGVLSIPVALSCLFIGIVLGDSSIYLLGRIASTYPRLGRYVGHDFFVPFRTWLQRRYVLTVFSARFIPGSRFLTYVACGFFRLRFPTFFLTAIAAASIWTTILFSASYWFGGLTSHWLAHLRWGIVAVFLLLLFFIGRHNLRLYRAKKAELEI